MGKTENKNTGKIGEGLAEVELIRKGYRIVERNWGNKWGEIDLVCEKNKQIIFVEVKTKIGERFGTPEEMVNKGKLAKVKRMGESYLIENRLQNALARIDVVAVVLDQSGEVLRMNHYEGVY